MGKARIDLFYPKAVLMLPDGVLYQSYYCYEDELSLSPDKWLDIYYQNGNFLLQHQRQSLHINVVDLTRLLGFLVDGLLLCRKGKEIYQEFHLPDHAHRKFLMCISCSENGDMSISRVGVSSDEREYLERDPELLNSCTLRKNISINRVYFQVTVPVSALAESIVEKYIHQYRWHRASYRKELPANREIINNLSSIVEDIAKSTGVALKTVGDYLSKLEDRREFLEEELKWLFALGYGRYNHNDSYRIMMKSICHKVANGGIRIHLKRFNDDQEEWLSIESLGQLEAYFKKMDWIYSLDDMLEDRDATNRRMEIERQKVGHARLNPMLSRGLQRHQETRFKRQSFYNPEGLRDSVLKRRTEAQTGIKSNWITYRNLLKY